MDRHRTACWLLNRKTTRRRGRKSGLLLVLCAALLAAASLSLAPRMKAAENVDLPNSQAKLNTQILPNTLVEKLAHRGSISLKETSITDAMYTISEAWEVNIVVRSDVEGQVNGVFKNAPLSEILNSLLLLNGYSYRPVGESIVVMSLADVGDVNHLFETAIVPLRYGDPKEILAAVQVIKSPRGKVNAIPSSKSLMVVDFPDRVAMIRTRSEELDQAAGRGLGARGAGSGGTIEVGQFVLQYVQAGFLKDTVESLLSPEGKASIVQKENRIVVADYISNLRVIGDAIKKLDSPRAQVRISALIYDISLEDMEQLGINWSHAVKGRNLNSE